MGLGTAGTLEPLLSVTTNLPGAVPTPSPQSLIPSAAWGLLS